MHITFALNEQDVDANPFTQFQVWFDEAVAAQLPEPNAMTLATATRAGVPAARIVLMRGFDARGFAFFSNYDSRKGRELAENPLASLVFHWQTLHRQVRVEGTVAQVSAQESDAYFESRPAGSRLGAWASRQSEVVASRAALEARMQELEAQYRDQRIPRPPHWGGYRVTPHTFEFWQGRPSRLHDRLRYRLQSDGSWRLARLAP